MTSPSGDPGDPCAAVAAAREDALRRFREGASGVAIAETLCRALDTCLLSSVAWRPGDPWALLALGSYGRRELSFASDVDCLVLFRGGEPEETLARVTAAVRDLWSRGVRAAVAVYDLRRAAALARTDDKVLATLLDRRFLCGDKSLARRLDGAVGRLATADRVRRFARFLQQEDDRRTGQPGQDLFAAEPDLKLARGGLRDLASVRWLAYLGGNLLGRGRLGPDRESRLAPALDATVRGRHGMDVAREALLTARHLLGGVLGTRRERLTRDAVQSLGSSGVALAHLPGLGRRLAAGRGDVAALRSWLLDVLAAPPVRRSRSFPGLEESRGCVRLPPGMPDPAPGEILRLAVTAAARGRVLDPGLRCRTRLSPQPHGPALGPALREALATPGGAPGLPWLLESGLLTAAIPSLRRTLGLVPGDEVHAFNVDRHGVKVAEEAAALLDGRADVPPNTAPALQSGDRHRTVLLLAGLMHDAGKSAGPPHAEVGARLALAAAQSLGLPPDDADRVSGLCREHMRFPEMSISRDCDDPSVLDGLADAVGTPERLDLLYLLAVADLRALGPDRAGSFREGLLARAWRGARERMDLAAGREDLSRRLEERRESLARKAGDAGLPRRVSDLARALPDRVVAAFDEGALWSHLLLLDQARSAGARVALAPAGPGGAWEVTFVGRDELGLLSRICGALFLEGLSIQEARIFCLPSSMVLDQFRVVDAGERTLGSPEGRARLAEVLARAADDLAISDRVRLRMRSILRGGARPVRLLADVDNTASDRHTTFRVTGPDAPGLLHLVADLLYRNGMNVTGAVVTTVGGTAVDTFFAEWAGDGGKVTDPEAIRRVLRALAALSTPS